MFKWFSKKVKDNRLDSLKELYLKKFFMCNYEVVVIDRFYLDGLKIAFRGNRIDFDGNIMYPIGGHYSEKLFGGFMELDYDRLGEKWIKMMKGYYGCSKSQLNIFEKVKLEK